MTEQETKPKMTNADLVRMLDDKTIKLIWNGMGKSAEEWCEWLKEEVANDNSNLDNSNL